MAGLGQRGPWQTCGGPDSSPVYTHTHAHMHTLGHTHEQTVDLIFRY